MMKETVDFKLEALNEYKDSNHNYIYIKGWAFALKYTISLKQNEKEIIRFSGNVTRHDIAVEKKDLSFAVNSYGFEKFISVEDGLNIKVFLLANGEEILLNAKTDNENGFFNILRKYFTMFKKALSFFWKEYRFFVPPLMIKKYLVEFKVKRNTLRLGNSSYYNQNIDYEYWEWIKKREKIANRTSLSDLSFLLDEEIDIAKDEVLSEMDPGSLFSISKELNEIKTKYCCIILKGNKLSSQFFTIMQYLNEDDVVYFDHDQFRNGQRCKPIFAPDYAFESLMGIDYIGGVAVFKTEYLLKHRKHIMNIHRLCLEALHAKVKHIDKIMFHSMDGDMTNMNSSTVNYINDHSLHANIIENYNGSLVVTYEVKDEPKISIIIPTKDHAGDLEKCLSSVFQHTTYGNFEVLVVDNNSDEEETFKLLNDYSQKHLNFKSLRLECEFNFSYLNNEAVKHTDGQYLLFLNNDTEVITGNWIELMLGYAQQSEIGTVGAKLLFGDDTIQHAGLIMGKGGVAGHANYGKQRYDPGQQSELLIPYNCSGSTAACLMIERTKFNLVEGYEEILAVAYNDVDFNLKIAQKGFRNVYLPNVELYHYESKSRGLDTSVEKQQRFLKESQYMKEKWKIELKHDTYYNDNFSLNYDYLLDAKE